MPDIVTVDASSFVKALNEYAEFDKREMPTIINAKLGDWAWEAAKRSPSALAAHIRMIKDNIRGGPKTWWRFVQSVYNAGFRLKGRRKARGAEANVEWIDPSTRKRHWGRKTVTYYRDTTEGNHRKNDLKRVSASIIKRRVATVKHLASQFLFVALRLGKNVAQVGGKNSWKFRGIDTRLAPLGIIRPQASFSIPWRARTLENKRHEGDRSNRVNFKLTMALQAINRAQGVVVADMQQKTAERYARKAASLGSA